MAEYITKEQALRAVRDAVDAKDEAIDAIEMYIDALTVLDVAPVVHGEWVWQEDTLVCSICQRPAPTEGEYVQVETPYCPQCGARMDGEEEW